MSAAEILRECQGIGVSVHIAGDNLQLEPKRLINRDLLAKIKAHKPALLAKLRAANDAPTPEPKPVAKPRRYPIQYKITMPNGIESGGIRLEDQGLDNAVAGLLAMYGARLDLDDLLDEIRERFAIIAESEPDDLALRLALDRAEQLIQAAR